LVVGGVTAPLIPSPAATIAPLPAPAPITIGTQIVTANSQSQYLVAGQTLAPGGAPVTVAGSTISLAPSATALIVDGRTFPLVPFPAATVAPLRIPAPITVGTQVITANSQSQYLVSGQTLVPGGQAITVNGTPVSLGLSATNVVIGSSTIGLGGAIISGLGGTVTQVASVGRGSTASAYVGPLYTGAAPRAGYPNVMAALVGVTLMIDMCI
jgi:hypothetical protein